MDELDEWMGKGTKESQLVEWLDDWVVSCVNEEGNWMSWMSGSVKEGSVGG